jgi:lipid-A-disaccharide synthase
MELQRAGARRAVSPRAAVGLELARALGGLVLLPARAFDFAMCSDALREELADELHRPVPPEPAPAHSAPPERRLRLFVSCAEASGEAHALSLVAALRERLAALGAPEPELTGLGGRRLRAAGVRLAGEPVERAAMGFEGMLASLPYYLGLLEAAARVLRDERPDACALVDSPALHVPLGRIARRYGVPVVHHVAPQLWGWAPWRVAGYRGAVDRALTILPFERAWLERRGVRAHHVGHPLLDQLPAAPPPRADEASRTLVLLPGSRAAIIDRNLPWMLSAAARLRLEVPEIEVEVAHTDPAQRARLAGHLARAGAEGWARLALGDLHGTLERARAALSVSGTVLIDLLHQRLPAVVVYRLASRAEAFFARRLLLAPFFASPNLLAAREVYPEFCFAGEGPMEAVCAALRRCYNDPAWRRSCRQGLDLAARRLGPAGASDRAAANVLAAALGERNPDPT